MINFILIITCISIGIIFSYKKFVPKDAYKGINIWVLYVALPALALRFVPQITFSINLLLPLLGPVLIWCGAWLFISIYDWKKKMSIASRTALFVACGLGNTAFLGFPMISAFFGETELHYAIMFDQATFFLFATIGTITVLQATQLKTEKNKYNTIFKKIISFPPLIACLTALILPYFIDISLAFPFLDKLVATMSPMALFSIGLQLHFGKIKQEWRMLTAGLFYKLLIAPCLVLLLAFLFHVTGNLAKISVFEAGMSSHITISLLASQKNLNPDFCSLIVGLGIIVGFLTSTIWFFIVQTLF